MMSNFFFLKSNYIKFAHKNLFYLLNEYRFFFFFFFEDDLMGIGNLIILHL